MKTGDRVYRMLLRAFPHDVRAEAADQMAADVREKRKAASGRPLTLTVVWMAAIHDALWHGLLQRAGIGAVLTTRTLGSVMKHLLQITASFFSFGVADDARLAVRRLVKAPGFTSVALLTMTLGIGATSAIFSVVYAVLLAPLPFPAADRLVDVSQVSDGERSTFAPPNFLDVQRLSTTITRMGAYDTTTVTLADAGDPVRITAVEVSAGFFDALQTPPLAGRTLQTGDNEAGRTNVVVLGHPLWRSRFGARTDLVGQTVNLDGQATVVVGIMPEGFAWPESGQVWRPVKYTDAYKVTNRGAQYLDVVGRLAPGSTIAEARAELASIAAQLAQAHEDNTDMGLTAIPLLDATVGERRTALLLLFGAVAVVLLIAVTNVANLMLARSATRENEFAVRAALGAGYARLARQLLMESFVLAGAGAVLGLALAYAATRALIALGPADLPRLSTIGLNTPVVVFTIGVAMLTGLLFGLWPALQAGRASFGDALRERGRSAPGGSRGRRARSALVVAELALAVVLLVGAGLLLRSFARLVQVDPGFDTANGITFSLALPEATYDSDQKRLAFHARLREQLEALPGVAGSALALSVPPSSTYFNISFTVTGRPPLPPGEEEALEVRVADAAYFPLMGIPVTRGRGFDETDRAGSPQVLVLTESAASLHFPGQDPVGQTMELGWRRSGVRIGGRIVGVVADVKSHGLDQEVPPQVYVPYSQVPLAGTAVLLRTHGAPEPILPLVRAAVAAVDPRLPIGRVVTLEEHVSRSVAEPRFYMLLLATFAAVALVLAAAGIFGVLSYLVSQRTREIGIRMALGAGRNAVIGLVLRQALLSAGFGVAIGLGAAYALSHLVVSMLFDVTAADPVTFVTVAAVMLAVALIAAWMPARRAVRVAPTEALRVG